MLGVALLLLVKDKATQSQQRRNKTLSVFIRSRLNQKPDFISEVKHQIILFVLI